jgi:hypothetical protein
MGRVYNDPSNYFGSPEFQRVDERFSGVVGPNAPAGSDRVLVSDIGFDGVQLQLNSKATTMFFMVSSLTSPPSTTLLTGPSRQWPFWRVQSPLY